MFNTAFYRRLAALLGLGLLTITTSRAAADDWPNWRGANRDAICRETGLSKQWPADGPPLLWKATGMGEGYSGPAIVGKVLYTMGNIDGKEWVLALDTTTGKRIWAQPIGPVEYDDYSPGTRSTPTIDGNRLYALGASGQLVSMDIADGRTIWRKSFLADFGGTLLKWGFSESVLIDGDRLICTPGGPKAKIMALDKKTGRTVWGSEMPDRACYASMIKATLAGRAQYVQLTGDALVGVDAETGKLLWRYDAPTHTLFGGINISTPIASGSTVFAATGYGVGGGLVRIEKAGEGCKAEEVYFTKEMKNHHGGMILLDGYLYGCNDPSIITCLEFATGKVQWRSRKAGKCSLLCADGMLYCRDEKGPISLVEATPDRFNMTGRFTPPDRSKKNAWPHLVIAHGQMYVRDQDVLLCYDVR